MKYAIAISPDDVSHEFRVTLRGPGIDSDGRRYVFANTYRCSAFVDAVNFAYEHGFRDGCQRQRSTVEEAEEIGSNTSDQGNAAGPQRSARRRVTLHLPVETAKRAKNCVYWTPGLTLGDLIAEGLEIALERIEKKHGGPCPPRGKNPRVYKAPGVK